MQPRGGDSVVQPGIDGEFKCAPRLFQRTGFPVALASLDILQGLRYAHDAQRDRAGELSVVEQELPAGCRLR